MTKRKQESYMNVNKKCIHYKEGHCKVYNHSCASMQPCKGTNKEQVPEVKSMSLTTSNEEKWLDIFYSMSDRHAVAYMRVYKELGGAKKATTSLVYHVLSGDGFKRLANPVWDQYFASGGN